MGRHRKRQRQEKRDHNSITSLLSSPVVPLPRVSPAIDDFRRIQDRRRFSFDRSKQPLDGRGVPARVAMKSKAPARVRRGPGGRPLKSKPKGWFPKAIHQVQAFVEAPSRLAICLRRKMRREVLFAEKKTRKGAGSPKRWNEWSEIHCK